MELMTSSVHYGTYVRMVHTLATVLELRYSYNMWSTKYVYYIHTVIYIIEGSSLLTLSMYAISFKLCITQHHTHNENLNPIDFSPPIADIHHPTVL